LTYGFQFDIIVPSTQSLSGEEIDTMAKATHGHVIEKVDYSEDYLLCTCGWEGKAYDDIRQHAKTAPPVTDKKILRLEVISAFNRPFTEGAI
jgi:hypothetical protein